MKAGRKIGGLGIRIGDPGQCIQQAFMVQGTEFGGRQMIHLLPE